MRSFPYASLNDTSFTSIAGYVAGVANPIFEQQGKWWDVFADCDKGKVTVQNAEQDKLVAVYSGLSNELVAGLSAPDPEKAIRASFRNTTLRVLDEVFEAGQDEWFMVDQTTTSPDKTTAPIVIGGRDQTIRNIARAANYVTTSGFTAISESRRGEDREVTRARLALFNLRSGVIDDVQELVALFAVLDAFVSDLSNAFQLLSWLPMSRGGLLPIAKFLFAASVELRQSAISLLRRLDSVADGCVSSSLDPFLVSAYTRATAKLPHLDQC
mmetsp:Transcript_44664/g.105011  ORF Transcript_44664/g.105011 Transcript_44664/m.105011 type:complete len:270 (-) Transcript_44664:390-1199(-)